MASAGSIVTPSETTYSLAHTKANWILDSRLQRQVALKILQADASKNCKELSILLHLSRSILDHPGKKHVIELLDHFEHVGPNGTHLCLVHPAMVSDGVEMTIYETPRYSAYVQAISKQVLLGLNFLHTAGIIHCGKMAPERIMVSIANSNRPPPW